MRDIPQDNPQQFGFLMDLNDKSTAGADAPYEDDVPPLVERILIQHKLNDNIRMCDIRLS